MKKRYLFAGAAGVIAGAVAAKLLTRPRDVSWPNSIDLIYHPEYSWFTTIGGVRIHYQEAGDESAPPIILIHGFISSNLVWNEVILPLAQKGFRVIAPDLPGYGYSDKPADGRYTIDSQAYAVSGLMDRLGIESATIVGASYGGAVAATMALDYPERVANLVLVGAVTNDQPKKKLLLRLAGVPLLGDIATPLFLGSRWISREASLIRQPTLLVWGEEDTHIPVSDAFRLRDAIPNSRLIVFRRCGHLPPTESPEKFVEAVADFCKSERVRAERPPTLEDQAIKDIE